MKSNSVPCLLRLNQFADGGVIGKTPVFGVHDNDIAFADLPRPIKFTSGSTMNFSTLRLKFSCAKNVASSLCEDVIFRTI